MLRLDPKNLGRLFERKMLFGLKSMEVFDAIHDENTLKKRYGWKASSVDYMLELPEGLILMQIKWRASRRRENAAIMNFLGSIKYIQDHYNKPMLFGMWVSRMEPFEDNKQLLKNNNIHCVHHFESIESLVKQSTMALHNHLKLCSKRDTEVNVKAIIA